MHVKWPSLCNCICKKQICEKKKKKKKKKNYSPQKKKFKSEPLKAKATSFNYVKLQTTIVAVVVFDCHWRKIYCY